MINSRSKGKRGELEWASKCRQEGFQARRGQQFSGSPDSPDVISNIPFHQEVKRVNKLNLRDAVTQASHDSNGKPWLIAHRWDHGPWLVTMHADHWFELLRETNVGNETE